MVSEVDVSQIIYVVKSRLVFWFKAKYPNSFLSREDIIADPSLADKSKFSGQSRFSVMSWTPPPPGVLKLNVYGVVALKGRVGGVGGLLRNSDGKCLFSFIRHVGQVSPLLAKILPIKIGLELFFNSDWRNIDSVIVESDNKVAVEWILYPGIFTGIFLPLVKEIVSMVGLNPILFRHISRGGNIDADRLAKRGIG
ncbi:hypothetical protein GQ457_15G019670 [Hibiscus cannabinus]